MAADAQRIDPLDVFDLLAQLHDRSLVVLDEQSTEPRYRLLETVRQYGRDLLAEDKESGGIFKNHLDYFTLLSEECEPKIKGRQQVETLALLERESENIRAALERSTSGEGSENLMSLAANLAIFWWRQGHFAEGTEWCLRAAATPFGAQRTVLRARVLNAAGLLFSFQGDCAKAFELYKESHGILSEIGDRKYLAEALCGLGFAAFFLDDYAASRKYTNEAYATAKEVGDLWYTAWTGYFLGIIARVSGDFDGAIRSYQEAMAIFRKLGDRMSASYPTYDIGLAEYYRGNLGAAKIHLTESLEIRRQSNDLWGVSESLFGLGLVAVMQGEVSAARDRLEESKAVAKEVGDKTRIAICAHWLGQISLMDGDIDCAQQHLNESFEIYESLEDRWGLAHCLAAGASIAVNEQDWKTAVQLWSASDKLREDIGSPLPPVERAHREEYLKKAREQIGNDQFDASALEGREMSFEQALKKLPGN